jgi:hypothetical protein
MLIGKHYYKIIIYWSIFSFMKKFSLYALLPLVAVLFITNIANADTVQIPSHTSDMGIRVSPYPGAWAVQFSATYGMDQGAPDNRALAYTASKDSNAGIVAIYRSFMSFDTSAIPDNAQITSARLVVFADTVLDLVNDQYSYMNVLQGFQASPTTTTFDDIEKCGNTLINPTKGAADVDVSTITEGAPFEFSLNAAGTGWINKSGYTQLCLREGHDIENIEPVNNNGVWKETGISHYTSEAPGTNTDPYLEVVYTMPDEDPTLEELIETFRDTVALYDLPHKAERSYFTQIRFLEVSVDRERYKAAYAQTLVLKLSLIHDKKKGVLTIGEYTELMDQLAVIGEEIASLK